MPPADHRSRILWYGVIGGAYIVRAAISDVAPKPSGFEDCALDIAVPCTRMSRVRTGPRRIMLVASAARRHCDDRPLLAAANGSDRTIDEDTRACKPSPRRLASSEWCSDCKRGLC